MRRSILILAAAAVGLATAAVPPASAAGVRSHVHAAGLGDFPDPGFAKFGSTYYLYSTGDGYPVARTTKVAGAFTRVGKTSPGTTYPSWNGVAPRFGRHHWAPHVFQVTSGGKPLYVMYFSAWKSAGGWNNDCVGIATSRSPVSGFRSVKTSTGVDVSICTAKGYEAIDASMYLAKNGKRYLIYKKGRYSNPRFFSIVAVEVDAATGTKLIGARTKLASTTSSETMEAPSFVAHGGKVWMFVSRGSFEGNKYRTEVWSAPSFLDPGGFTKVKNLVMNTTAGKPFVSPGGATVLQDGSVTRIAFHATVSGKRPTYVGQLTWAANGTPSLY